MAATNPSSNSVTAAPQAAQRIAVAGTGVVGLAVALGCAQRGWQVSLVGPAPHLAAPPPGEFDARIYALSEGARGLLEAQRAWAQVDASRLCPVLRMDVAGDAGGHLRFDAQAAGVERLATICEERELLRALWLACSLSPGISHVPARFEGADFGSDAVELRLEGGGRLACALLVGADGKHSVVRTAAGVGAHSQSYGHTAFVANFAASQDHGLAARQWFTDEGVVALLPLPDGHVSLVWSAPHARAPELAGLDPAAFARRLEQRVDLAPGSLRMVGSPRSFPLDRVVVERLAGPRLALMGDAAHVVHPLAGQGLNLGLQDVSDFLRLLSAKEAWRDVGDAVWLRRYERARAEPVALMRSTVGALASLFGSPGAAVRQLRNFGLSAVDALAPVKHALVRHALG